MYNYAIFLVHLVVFFFVFALSLQITNDSYRHIICLNLSKRYQLRDYDMSNGTQCDDFVPLIKN